MRTADRAASTSPTTTFGSLASSIAGNSLTVPNLDDLDDRCHIAMMFLSLRKKAWVKGIELIMRTNCILARVSRHGANQALNTHQALQKLIDAINGPVAE